MRDRFCPVLDPDFVPCRPPFSFYRFIDKYWPSEGNRTLHRVFSLSRKMGAQTMVVEKLDRAKELEIEAAAVETRCQGPVKFQAWRFSFFTVPVTCETLPYADDADYLGYAILLCLRLPNGVNQRYVYESVIVEPAFHEDGEAVLGHSLPAHYVHCVRRYCAWVAGHRFTLLGSFFSQQNSLTNVCGHAALRCLLNNLPERAERMISCEDINRELGIDHKSCIVGRYGHETESQGLRLPDLLQVVNAYGWRHIPGIYREPAGKPEPYWRFVYSVIESGFPVLVFFTARGSLHVICVIGHTLNTDAWDEEAKLAYSGAPRAQYLSSASWMDHFLIHDDNYGMYFCMPSKALSPTTTEDGPFQIAGAFGIVPAQIELGPVDAELFASAALRLTLTNINLHSCYWVEALRQEANAFGKWLVLRTLLTSRAAYQQHLQEIEDVDGNALKADEIAKIMKRNLPEHFWITEITMTDIYTANKHKVGEVLFDPSDPLTDQDSQTYTRKMFSKCLAIRLPGNIVIPDVQVEQPISMTVTPTDLTGHVPLLRMRREIPCLEW
jgi:hypothetical protein